MGSESSDFRYLTGPSAEFPYAYQKALSFGPADNPLCMLFSHGRELEKGRGRAGAGKDRAVFGRLP